MSRGKSQTDQELLREVIVDFLELEDERLGDAHDYMMTEEEIRHRCARYNAMTKLANEDWLQLGIIDDSYTDEYIEKIVRHAFD